MSNRHHRKSCAEFFEDDFGRLSMTRLTLFLCILVALFIAIWTTTVKDSPNSGTELILTLLTIPTLGKGFKSVAEIKEKEIVSSSSENSQ